jgi:hypothetical protein
MRSVNDWANQNAKIAKREILIFSVSYCSVFHVVRDEGEAATTLTQNKSIDAMLNLFTTPLIACEGQKSNTGCIQIQRSTNLVIPLASGTPLHLVSLYHLMTAPVLRQMARRGITEVAGGCNSRDGRWWLEQQKMKAGPLRESNSRPLPP